jgi:hypothetical protein
MERRSDPRSQIHQPVKVGLDDRSHDQWDGVIIDISGSGMKISMDRSVALQSKVRLNADGLVVVARVVFCLPDADRFAVGVEVEGVQWQEPSGPDDPVTSSWQLLTRIRKL